MKVFASHNPNPEIRRESSSGGVFSILAHGTISQGGTVYAARFAPDWSVETVRATSLEELRPLRGSKYVFAPIGPSLELIRKDLNEGRRVLVVSTPCQIAAVRHQFGHPPYLLLVEVVCHGTPEIKFWNRYLDELCAERGFSREDIASLTFRDKSRGWKHYSFRLKFKAGQEISEWFGDNLYMRSFLFGYTVREICFRCPFKYPDGSRADITIGDLWGIEKLAPEIDNDLGTTLVIARTDRGNRVVELLPNDGEIDFAEACNNNRAITNPPRRPDKFKEFRESFKESGNLLEIMKVFAARKLTKQK